MSAMPSSDPDRAPALGRRGFLAVASRALLWLTGGASAIALSRYLAYEPPRAPANLVTLDKPETYPAEGMTMVAGGGAGVWRPGLRGAFRGRGRTACSRSGHFRRCRLATLHAYSGPAARSRIHTNEPRPVMKEKPTMGDLLEPTAALHRHLCPRQVLGVRMGMLAGELLGVDLPQSDKRR